MTREILQTHENKRKPRNILPNALRAASVATVLTAGTLLPNVAYAMADAENLIPDSNTPVLTSAESKSDQIANLLHNDDSRAVLFSGLGLSLAALANSYLISKKYDDNKLEKTMRLSGPTLFSIAASSLIFDSYQQISAEIPASIIVGASFLVAGQSILNTNEHEKDLKIRASAIAVAGGFIALGLSTFMAVK